MNFQTLSTLPQATVEQAVAQVVQRVQELHTDLDLESGVLSKFVAELGGILAGAIDTELAKYLSARSLLDITNSPTTADTDMVDRILSNFGVTRGEGLAAYGTIAIVVQSGTTKTVPVGTSFAKDGFLFLTERVYTASIEGDPLTDSSRRRLVDLGDGRFQFTVPVIAAGVGTGYRLPRGTTVVPLPVPYQFLTAYAYEDFLGGIDVESNDTLLQRLQIGISAKAVSNRSNILASLYNQPAFAKVARSSVIGFGDREMGRDRPGVLGVSVGGAMDIYVRPGTRATRQTRTGIATCVATSGGTNTWEIVFSAADNAGIYTNSVFQKPGAGLNAGGYPETFQARSVSLPATGFYPRLSSATQAAFGSYMSTRVRFDTADIDVAGIVGDRKVFQYIATGLPLVSEMQDYFNDRAVRSFGADIHVLAAIPYFVRVAMEIQTQSTDTVDIATIKEAVANRINDIGFTGRLHASTVSSAVHVFLPTGAGLSSLSLLGRLVDPSGTVYTKSSSTLLDLPPDVSPSVTENTVQFFCSPDDVGVTLSPIITTPA